MTSNKVYPGAKRPSHQISLSDGRVTYGLRLEDGERSIQEIPMTPSTVNFTGGGTKFGDWEPGMSHIEQRTWEGGRALESFVDDPTRFFDSKMAWTLTPGKLFPVPMWKFGKGHITAYENMPGDLGWRAMYGTVFNYRRFGERITHSSGWANADTVLLWVKRVGTPEDLTISLTPDLSIPPSVYQPDYQNPYVDSTLAATDVNENEITLVSLDVSSAGALSGTTSWLLATSNGADNAANHWEIGIDIDGGTAYSWQDGIANWNPEDYSVYYRLTAAATDRKWHFFEFLGAMYAVDQKADNTASKLYINGDRGKCSSGCTASTLQDTTKSWTTNEWAGCYVKIVGGTPASPQMRKIASNTGTVLTLESDWDKIPTTASFYVIVHSDKWTDISPTSGDQITNYIVDVCVVDDYVCLVQRPGSYILKMRWNSGASPPAHEFDFDGTNVANFVYTFFDESNDVQVYRAYTQSCTVGRATPTAWGTAMTFGTHFDVGDSDDLITGFVEHDGKLYVTKTDGRYLINSDDTATKQLGEIGFINSLNNGEAALSHGRYLYSSWGEYALQRIYDSSGDYDITSVGPDRDEGLPSDRKGKIVALVGTPPGIIAAVDAGEDGYSSILVLPENAFGWHEIFRGWDTGKRVQNMYWQDSYRPRLWISVGGELVYQDWPLHSFNPLKDSTIEYYPEAQLISSTIDMGAFQLPKVIKEIGSICENLSGSVQVYLDYQVNEDVGTSTWINAGVYQINPVDSLPINAGEVRQIRFRLRLVTEDADTPPIVKATVVEGFARTPVKYQWRMRIKVSSTQRDMSGVSKDVKPGVLLKWLKESATRAIAIKMGSVWPEMDSKYVVVEPPSLIRKYTNYVLGFWGGSIEITVREY